MLFSSELWSCAWFVAAEEKFEVLCATYITLNRKRHCSIPDALAQTCWVKIEKNGKLHVDEAY